MDILAVILAYNEENNLENVVRDVHRELGRIPGNHEVLIVDDGSRDDTGEVAKRVAGELANVRVIRHPENRGLGGVYRTGFENASKSFITFWPADGQFDPGIMSTFAELMPDHDLVLGYLPNRKRTPLGRFLSASEKLVYRALFGPLPKFQGVFMLRASVLDEIELCSEGRGWAIVNELIIRVARGNYRITSVPTDLRPRLAGDSKVTDLKTIASNLKQIVELRRRMGR